MDNQVTANITTAVDSLVSLINEKKRISMEEAAHSLGLPESIINEWASFLEEEHILGIEYQLTTPILVAVDTREEEESKKSDISDENIERDLLIRKIQFMTSSLDKNKLNPTIKIGSIDDLKKAVNSDLSGDNKLYAQKVYLKIKLDQLLKRLEDKKEDIFRINQELMVLEKRKKAFESNF